MCPVSFRGRAVFRARRDRGLKRQPAVDLAPVVKYLAGDTSDDNFIRVAEQSLEFVAGIAKGTTEQARNPNGELIYWEADPAGASIGADGYPYANGERIFTTTKRSNWPVMVYQYF